MPSLSAQTDQKRPASHEANAVKYLIFEIGTESYGLQISYVNEIIGVQNITEVPEQPNYILGIINLRGKIIPVMDVRLRFRKEPRVYDDRTCVIVVNISDVLIGLIIDRVIEVKDLFLSQISLPPKLSKEFKNRYIKGIGRFEEQVYILLDCDKLLLEDETGEILEVFDES